MQSLQQSSDGVSPCALPVSGGMSEACGPTRLKEQCLYLASATPHPNFATKKIQLYGKESEIQLGSFQNKMKS